MKDSHRELHRSGTLIRGQDADIKPDLNHEGTPGLASQQAFHGAESAVASRLDVFRSSRPWCCTLTQ